MGQPLNKTWLAIVLLTWLALSSTARAYHPDSPEVQAIVDRAIDYLESNDGKLLGEKCLVGLAMIKADRPADHPKVLAAVQACRETINAPKKIDDIYSLGISIIFLCELDAQRYKSEITTLLQILDDYQKPHGGWGYVGSSHRQTGDTSMTQYAVLAQWSAYRQGIRDRFPGDRIGPVCNWLIRTQDPAGAWGYQGVDPGNFNRTQQNEIRHSLCAAGLSSSYICADLLGLKGAVVAEEGGSTLPPELQAVDADAKPRRRNRTGLVNQQALKRAMKDGDRYFKANHKIEVEVWPCYYLYAFERYQSFKEFYEGTSKLEPAWYNEGVAYFKKKQQADGSFYGQCPTPAATSFAILFLKRSTKRSLEKSVDFYDGILAGGRGLPKSSVGVQLKAGRIAPSPFKGEVESLLAVLERGDTDELESLDTTISVTIAVEPKQRTQQLARLERLAQAKDHQVRLAAIRAISSARSVDAVPTLIYALGDPDRRAVLAARDGLRFLSRKFDGFGLPDRFTLEQKLVAIDAWKEWFLTIRPDTKFLN